MTGRFGGFRPPGVDPEPLSESPTYRTDRVLQLWSAWVWTITRSPLPSHTITLSSQQLLRYWIRTQWQWWSYWLMRKTLEAVAAEFRCLCSRCTFTTSPRSRGGQLVVDMIRRLIGYPDRHWNFICRNVLGNTQISMLKSLGREGLVWDRGMCADVT